MLRREFLTVAPAFLPAVRAAQPVSLSNRGDQIFQDILRGYIFHSYRTSPSMVVCEFPNATVTKNFLCKSGLSTTAFTRMLPAMAAWIVSGRAPQEFEVGGR